jgi:hypothetical protein
MRHVRTTLRSSAGQVASLGGVCLTMADQSRSERPEKQDDLVDLPQHVARLVQDGPVNWDDAIHDALDVALNEAEVLGLRLEPSRRWCDLLVHVLALPETGPIDPDARRILRLTSPTRVRVLLRTDMGRSNYGPAIPFESLGAVEDFFASLSWSGAMYGWKFFDDPTLTRDWLDQPSLTIDVGTDTPTHSLYWFNECGRDRTAYCVEGTVMFVDLEVLRADTTRMSLEEFVADGCRHWQALDDHDERLSVEAQRVALNGTPSWRPHLRNAATDSGIDLIAD